MILETTYFDKSHKSLLEDIVGKPYSFWRSLKLKGIGSSRLMIENVSPNLKHYMNTVSDINYANIELRPQGILIYINKGLRNFIWAIPFYQLHIYKTPALSIHAQGKYIQFKNNRTFRENKTFFNKLKSFKINFDEPYNFLT